MWDAEMERLYPTAYQQEQAQFAALKRDLQTRKRARWRLWLGLMIAGRHRRLRQRPSERSSPTGPVGQGTVRM